LGHQSPKERCSSADTSLVDAAQRNEILSRYREHTARFESVAARRDQSVAEVIPFQPPVQEGGQEPTAREIEVLQLISDGPPPTRQAPSTLEGPRGRRRLPPRADRLVHRAGLVHEEGRPLTGGLSGLATVFHLCGQRPSKGGGHCGENLIN
jgi:hypothetical protein